MTTTANAIWERIDNKNQYKTLRKLMDAAGVDYGNVKKQRYLERVPRPEDLYNIAQALGCSMEYLITGEEYKSYPERIERIINNIMYNATEEDLLLIERILRIQKPAEKEEVKACLA